MTDPTSSSRRVALVTGAASGIGAATARRFLREGWHVAINHVEGQREAAEALAASADAPRGQRAIAIEADVTHDADCVRLVEATVHTLGRLDVLVNAAGISKMVPHARLHDVSAEDFQRIYAVNTIGPFQMMRAAAPHLKAAAAGASGAAAVVNIASRAALTGGGSSIPYAASKAAVNALTMSMARVLAPEVRVNAVCPALVEQGFVERLAPEMFAARRAHQIEVSPLKRIGHPDEVAEAIWWLATGASMMTGAIVELDFGMHLNAV
ncbi:MAG: SDR family oxidoreductase [Rubrivivax sp.]|nr:SDR family oxidoreductase [Rubrivivax sp.]